MCLRCCLSGCVTDRYPDCVRCEANIYCSDFIERDRCWLFWWYSLVNAGIAFKIRFFRRCAHCDRIMMLDKGPCCSEECWQSWIPF